ncbi:hypothetical protein HYW82_03620 [Candidatus Peregrinibacteria bacterium]|nr:hypothetical protein [Candidatus Peregrinibacteria bacterium]
MKTDVVAAKKIFGIFLGMMLMVLTAPEVLAVGFESGENVIISNDVDDDIYVVAGHAQVDGNVDGDVYVAGGQVVINGNVRDDLVVTGGRVTVSGNISGDVRVIGGQVLLFGYVGDDIVTAGGQIDVGRNAKVGGSLVGAAGILTVEGEIAEDMRGIFGVLILNGSVHGDVIVTVENDFMISPSARINGNLNYSAILEADVPAGVVQGKISFNEFERASLLEDITFFLVVQKLFSFLAALVLLALVSAFMPKMVTRAALLARTQLLKSFGVGLLTLAGSFIAAMILIITVIGVPIAMIILGMLIVVFFFTKVFVAAWLSAYIFDYRKKISRIKLFGMLVLGLLIYYIVGLIPYYAGLIVSIVFFITGVGSMALLKIEYWKFLRAKGKL